MISSNLRIDGSQEINLFSIKKIISSDTFARLPALVTDLISNGNDHVTPKMLISYTQRAALQERFPPRSQHDISLNEPSPKIHVFRLDLSTSCPTNSKRISISKAFGAQLCRRQVGRGPHFQRSFLEGFWTTYETLHIVVAFREG